MSRGWTLATVSVGASSLLTGLRHLLLDGRVPRDLGLTWQQLPTLVEAFRGGAPWTEIPGALLRPGGWLELLVAAVLALTGPGVLPFRLFELGWLAALLALVAAWASRVGGARAAFACTALVASMPAVVVYTRLSWIHVPEAVLCLATLVAWERDRSLARSGPWMALTGALALALRPSALAWMAPLALVVVLARPPRRSLALVAGAWLLGALPAALDLPSYLAGKLAARPRYALDVASIGEEGMALVGPVALALCAVGVALAARRRGRMETPLLLLVVWWALLPLLFSMIFRVGMDNGTLGFVALALLAGTALRGSWWPPLLAALPLLLFTLPQWIPPEASPAALRLLRVPVEPSLRNHYRACDRWTAGELEALTRATCTPPATCRVGADQGLLQPYGEEPGRLELLLTGLEGLDLVDLREHGPERPLDALVHYDCPELDPAWRRRFPDSLEVLRAVVRDQGMQAVWSRELDRDCSVSWSTPLGRVARPDLLPLQDGELSGWLPESRSEGARRRPQGRRGAP